MTVYFIRSGQYVKIGTTSCGPGRRIRGLQTGNPEELQVLAECPGDDELERDLHSRFSTQRHRGEWFRYSSQLASLIEYVKQFGTSDGWELAERRPERWVEYVAVTGSPNGIKAWDHDAGLGLKWQAALREIKEPTRRSVSWEEVTSGWGRLADDTLDAAAIEHVVSPEKYGPVFEAYWLERASDYPASSRSGINATAAMLADAPLAEHAAVWIQACIHELLHESDPCHSYKELVARCPSWRELHGRVYEAHPCNWHHAVRRTLPVEFELPRHCLLEVDDFLKLVAAHRVLIWSRYLVRCYWLDGYYERWPRER